MLYNIAGLIIDIDFHYPYGKSLCRDYIYNGECKPLFSVSVNSEMLKKERKLDIYNSDNGYLESLAVYREICKYALGYECMFMHCSALSYKGNGVLFTAPSGTGKSTHAYLWRKYFGKDVVMVNDDKPLLRRKDGKFFVFGTPWDGKHRISNNVCAPVKAILILSQSKDNTITRAENKQALYTLLNQTIRPCETELMDKVLTLTNEILQTIPIYKLECNISENAVLTAFNGIKENFDEN
jgi:hypothetical protein